MTITCHTLFLRCQRDVQRLLHHLFTFVTSRPKCFHDSDLIWFVWSSAISSAPPCSESGLRVQRSSDVALLLTGGEKQKQNPAFSKVSRCLLWHWDTFISLVPQTWQRLCSSWNPRPACTETLESLHNHPLVQLQIENATAINMKWRWRSCVRAADEDSDCVCSQGRRRVQTTAVLTIVSLQQVVVILASSAGLTSHGCWGHSRCFVFLFFSAGWKCYSLPLRVFVGRF